MENKACLSHTIDAMVNRTSAETALTYFSPETLDLSNRKAKHIIFVNKDVYEKYELHFLNKASHVLWPIAPIEFLSEIL